VEREVIIDRLLSLLVEFEIPATWCIVGHLFLDRCDGNHAEMRRPSHSWQNGDWYANDPGTDLRANPLFYGRDLVEKIRNCSVPQEIGSHSFSHVIFGDEGCSREVARSEVEAALRVAREQGLDMKSFVFPRNSVGHLDVIREGGFTCFRGPEPTWYEGKKWLGPTRRLAHLWDVILASEPPLALPKSTPEGVWNIPGSMIYFPMHGLRKYIPVARRVRRAIKGLEAAAHDRKIFHLWFHPTNLADETEKMLGGLRSVFDHARQLRKEGRLQFAPMRDLVPMERPG
jgi:hypothetical protein